MFSRRGRCRREYRTAFLHRKPRQCVGLAARLLLCVAEVRPCLAGRALFCHWLWCWHPCGAAALVALSIGACRTALLRLFLDHFVVLAAPPLQFLLSRFVRKHGKHFF